MGRTIPTTIITGRTVPVTELNCPRCVNPLTADTTLITCDTIFFTCDIIYTGGLETDWTAPRTITPIETIFN